MITIDQLLESVDLDFEPRFVTRDTFGSVVLWKEKPMADKESGVWNCCTSETRLYFNLKLSEFDSKDWTECIYEVPRKDKPVVKIENFTIFDFEKINKVVDKLNLLVDAVNELKGAKNE